jgi:nitrogen fixation NifU-like protein
MQIFLKFEKGRVKEASFLTEGCGSSMVCGSLAAELALNKTPEELTDITGEQILSILGVFPEEDQHCAFLASSTVQEALDDYMKKQAVKK